MSVRDLRNHGREVLGRVQAGETLIITSAGNPVAELRPLPRRYLTTEELISERKGWPAVDPGQLRAEIDSFIDQTI